MSTNAIDIQKAKIENNFSSKENKPRVYALTAEAELDFKMKAGDFTIAIVFKDNGGYDIFQKKNADPIVEKMSDGKVALHRGKERSSEAKASFDNLLNEIACHNTTFQNIDNTPDADLTETEFSSQAELGIDFNDTIKSVDTITYSRISKNFAFCIEHIDFYG